MKILVTGLPGSGKTTLVENVLEELGNEISICGFISREVRKDGKRTGFRLVDVKGEWEGTLADTISGTGPRVGRYYVKLKDIENALELIKSDCQLIIIDEIGPMELKSDRFITVMGELFQSRANILATIHYTSKHPLVVGIKRNPGISLYEISIENREKLMQKIISEIRAEI